MPRYTSSLDHAFTHLLVIYHDRVIDRIERSEKF
jgi:hypothetical protein